MRMSARIAVSKMDVPLRVTLLITFWRVSYLATMSNSCGRGKGGEREGGEGEGGREEGGIEVCAYLL